MNILFILQYYKIGGVQTVTHVLSNKFVQEGHNCNVLTLTPSKGEEIHPILNSRIGVSVIDSHTLSTKEAIIQLRNFLIDKNVDVIINQSGHLFRTTALIKNASKDLNIKIISVLHNTPSFGLKFRYKHNITGKLKYYKNILKLAYSYRKVYKNSDLYILLSESFISEFEKISRLKNLKKIRLISNPITIANEDFIYNFERKEKQIIFVGRLEYTQKRIERILNVWGKIQSEYKDWELTIVGDGPDILRLKNITENKNIQSVKFVGFQNFIDIFTRDDSFVHAFLFTALFSVCAVVLVNLVGFALALLVTQKFRGATLLRGIFFMPNMIGGLLLGFTWQFIFISIFEAFSKKTGIAAFSGWLSNPETGFIGLLILTVWQMSGYMMIVYIAQIQQIPESVKEAARIDGANSWQLMRYIILPLMMPAFTIGLFLSISSSFKMFDQNLALTQGGPYKSTEMIALNIYNSAFGANEFGFAQAKAIVFLIIVAGIGVTQLVITKRKEVEM